MPGRLPGGGAQIRGIDRVKPAASGNPDQHRTNQEAHMLHTVVLAASDNIQAAGFILRGIKGIFVAIGSVIAAIVCAVIAGTKGVIRWAGEFSACSSAS